jgi:xanthine dehydrogenase YagR molybdenum-binding subunit
MTTYFGTATSRVHGRAKVTGAAKYAGEYNTAGLAHASLVTSTIAWGRLARIDASEALSIAGVIDVLTHQHRPPMANTDSAYTALTRMTWLPKVRRSGRSTETGLCSAANQSRWLSPKSRRPLALQRLWVRVEYKEEAHDTDLYCQHDVAFRVAIPRKLG